jgi:predicted membrane protein
MSPVRIWIGLVLLALGVIGILQAAGAGLGGVIDWWPIAVIGLGLTALVMRRRATVGPLLIIALGFVLLADQLSWTTGSLFGPALLVVLGLIVLFGLTRSHRSYSTGSESTFALFGGTRVTDRSEHLQRCDATAIAGSVTLDLREARIDETATVEAFALMGGVDVLVPHGWRVAINGTPILGGFDDKTRGDGYLPPNAPVLKIDGLAILGGVTVANEPRTLEHPQDTRVDHTT